MFRSPEAVLSFLKFYSQFDYMKPPKVGKDVIQMDLTKTMSLKQQLTSALSEVFHRRQLRGRHDQVACCLLDR